VVEALMSLARPEHGAAQTLDDALQAFSRRFANSQVSQCIAAPYVDCEDSLIQTMKALQQEVFERLYLHEFFLINIADTVK
jgi:hypothetical protein